MINATLKESIYALARGDCLPSTFQEVRGGVYHTLRIPGSIREVTINCVVCLTGVEVESGSVTGTVIVPEGTFPVNLAGSLLNVRYWSLEQIGRHVGLL